MCTWKQLAAHVRDGAARADRMGGGGGVMHASSVVNWPKVRSTVMVRVSVARIGPVRRVHGYNKAL